MAMKRRPVMRGQKTKAIRIDPTGLALFREELKGDPEWAEYSEASESELVVLATMFARLHIQPDVFLLTTDAVQTLVDEAIRLNIGEVARALGGVAQMNPDKTITVGRVDGDSIETFDAKPPNIQRPTFLH